MGVTLAAVDAKKLEFGRRGRRRRRFAGAVPSRPPLRPLSDAAPSPLTLAELSTNHRLTLGVPASRWRAGSVAEGAMFFVRGCASVCFFCGVRRSDSSFEKGRSLHQVVRMNDVQPLWEGKEERVSGKGRGGGGSDKPAVQCDDCARPLTLRLRRAPRFVSPPAPATHRRVTVSAKGEVGRVGGLCAGCTARREKKRNVE